MSTVAERVRLAFNAATGESKPASSSWEAANPTHYLRVRNILGTRRREAVAQVTAMDSLNIKYLAVRSQDWTSVDAMTHLLRDAERRAKALVALADMLGSSGWHVYPIREPLIHGGLAATKDGNQVQVYSNGDVSGHDDVAVRLAGDAFEVALERTQAD
nr:MAG TPA: hypothetical protein [Caudoviricetes sp.]